MQMQHGTKVATQALFRASAPSELFSACSALGSVHSIAWALFFCEIYYYHTRDVGFTCSFSSHHCRCLRRYLGTIGYDGQEPERPQLRALTNETRHSYASGTLLAQLVIFPDPPVLLSPAVVVVVVAVSDGKEARLSYALDGARPKIHRQT